MPETAKTQPTYADPFPDCESRAGGSQYILPGDGPIRAVCLCVAGDWGYLVLRDGREAIGGRFSFDWMALDARTAAEGALAAADRRHEHEEPRQEP